VNHWRRGYGKEWRAAVWAAGWIDWLIDRLIDWSIDWLIAGLGMDG
jgi:hypothetical protein